MPKWFTEHELSVLDALTANNPAVLVSFGGTPAGMKSTEEEEQLNGVHGVHGEEPLGVERTGSENGTGRTAMRQRAGSMAR
jgi:hypothetical protein